MQDQKTQPYQRRARRGENDCAGIKHDRLWPELARQGAERLGNAHAHEQDAQHRRIAPVERIGDRRGAQPRRRHAARARRFCRVRLSARTAVSHTLKS